jgi:hypothetical protein
MEPTRQAIQEARLYYRFYVGSRVGDKAMDSFAERDPAASSLSR